MRVIWYITLPFPYLSRSYQERRRTPAAAAATGFSLAGQSSDISFVNFIIVVFIIDAIILKIKRGDILTKLLLKI